MKSYFFTIFYFYSSLACLWAQCTPTTSVSTTCSGANGAVANNQNINSGNTYWFAGTGTRSGLNLSGGTLIICGNMTLTSINLNSGTIVIANGGTLTIPATGTIYVNGNISFVNYGTVNVTADIVMQNSNNLVVNYGNWDMAGKKLELNSTTSRLINNGTASIGTLYIQSNNGGVCVGESSIMQVDYIVNNGLNAITSSAVYPKFGCIRLNTSATLNQNLSNTASLAVCKDSDVTTTGGATINAGNGFGSASVQNSCASCSGVLLSSGKVNMEAVILGEYIQVSWQLDESSAVEYVTLEKCNTGSNFKTIEKTENCGNNKHIYIDYTPQNCENYYRLAVFYKNGQTIYTKPVIVHYDVPLAQMKVAYLQKTLALGFDKSPCETSWLYVSVFTEEGKMLAYHRFKTDSPTFNIPLKEVNQTKYCILKLQRDADKVVHKLILQN